jgi:hypothetical protein
VTFPEAVMLATILTDLNWRRHVALDWDNQPFCRRIAGSIGEQSYPSWPFSNDPVRPLQPSASNDRCYLLCIRGRAVALLA